MVDVVWSDTIRTSFVDLLFGEFFFNVADSSDNVVGVGWLYVNADADVVVVVETATAPSGNAIFVGGLGSGFVYGFNFFFCCWTGNM